MAHITAFCYKSDEVLDAVAAVAMQVTARGEDKNRIDIVCNELICPEGAYGPTLDLIICDVARLIDMDRLARHESSLDIDVDSFYDKPIIVVEGFMPDGETLWFTKETSFVGRIPAPDTFDPKTWQHLLTVVDASKAKGKKCTPQSLAKAVRAAQSSIITLGKPDGLRCEG